MISRFLPAVALISAIIATSLAAAETPSTPKAKPDKSNFTEKITGHRLDQNKEKIPVAASFDMIYVPGGEFTMGSPDTEPGRTPGAKELDGLKAANKLDWWPREGPRHKVKVGNLWVGKCEVTWDEFDVFWQDETFPVAATEEAKNLGPDAITRPTNTFVNETYEHGREGFPAICMTHHAAMVYCNFLRKKTGRAYRLPTEAEWEYLARAGKGDTAYSFGNDPKDLGDYAWFKENSPDEDHPKGTTHKVGTRKPNPFGLHDMYGNVAEWTLDQYDPKAYDRFAENKLSIRPVTPPTADKWSHVIRGGCWADSAERCRSACRRASEKSWMKWDPQVPQSIWWLTRMDMIGFRVVIAEDEQPELIGLVPKVIKK